MKLFRLKYLISYYIMESRYLIINEFEIIKNGIVIMIKQIKIKK